MKLTEKEIDKLRIAAMKNNEEKLSELVSFVNEILLSEGCQTIDSTQIKFYPQSIGNTFIGETLTSTYLSEIIYRYYYPTAPSGIYAHFTTLEALESILVTEKKIRLTSMIKRKDDWEFKLFYEEHGITGYTREVGNTTLDETLMRELFYMSLTDNKTEEIDIKRGIWNYFGVYGKGVKIIFDISTQHIDFRKVCYQNEKIKNKEALLHKLEKGIYEKYKQHFVFASVSKIGGFYISKLFTDEFETRYLIKNGSGSYQLPFTFPIQYNPDQVPYISLNFHSKWGNFIPIKVQPGKNCERDKVLQIVNDSGLGLEVLPNAG